jgi:hypothetical protein
MRVSGHAPGITREYLPAGIIVDTAGTVSSVADDILAQLI